jgi:hypothetical protein
MALGKPQFSDAQLQAMIPHYFARDHTAPHLLAVNIYRTRQGRVFRVDIQADRNRTGEGLKFAFAALATLGQYAREPLREFIVVVHGDVRGELPVISIAPAECTLAHYVRHRTRYQTWYRECLRFQQM